MEKTRWTLTRDVRGILKEDIGWARIGDKSGQSKRRCEMSQLDGLSRWSVQREREREESFDESLNGRERIVRCDQSGDGRRD